MTPTERTGAHIEYTEDRDGVFTARCPELGISAEGSTMAEAEAAVLALMAERSAQLGKPLSAVVSSDRDTSLEPEEE